MGRPRPGLGRLRPGGVLPDAVAGGTYSPKVPESTAAAESRTAPGEGRVAPVQMIRLPLSESAVGTIRPVHETSVGSKLLARVMEVDLKAGAKVKAGDVLVRLDNRICEPNFSRSTRP